MKRSSMLMVAIMAAIVCYVSLSASPIVSEELKLRVGDKIRLKVHEWPELTGEFTVSSAGTITLPTLGHLRAADLSTTDLEGIIAERLQKKTGDPESPIVSVESTAPNPIFILGDVQHPGEFPFRPGMTVLHAIATAGGFYRPSDPGFLRLEREKIAARGDVEVLRSKLHRLAARRARLAAELSDREDIEMPSDLEVDLASNPLTTQLLSEERSILVTNRDSLKQQVQGLQQSRELYEREIQTIVAQIASEKLQLESVNRELEEIRALGTRGLTPLPRLLTLERAQAQIVGAQQGLEANILRARQNVATTEQRILDVQSERRQKLGRDIQQTRLELEETRTRLGTLRKLIEDIEHTASDVAGQQLGIDQVQRVLVISRGSGDGVRSFVSEESTSLRPGDIIKVDRRSPQTGSDERPSSAISQ